MKISLEHSKFVWIILAAAAAAAAAFDNPQVTSKIGTNKNMLGKAKAHSINLAILRSPTKPI